MTRKELELRIVNLHKEVESLVEDGNVNCRSALYGFLQASWYSLCAAAYHVGEYKEEQE